jgi:S1-C subfamily serine protease
MQKTSVVRIFATAQESDYESPWQATRPSSGTGSGVVVAPGKILTGAHVVADATFIQVQTSTHPDKFIARLAAVCHDSDLALLEVEDALFQDETTPAALGDQLPDLQDKVSVVGFPVGGEELSVTEGVVSRIELQRYAHSDRWLLAVTVDAAINNGNSGGPVFLDDQVVGIAFQSLDDAENIGEMVPTPLIRRFLEGAETRKQVLVPGLGGTIQTLENASLRHALKMQPGQSGVRIRTVAAGNSGDGVLKVDDVLMSFDGYDIANNGTIRYDDNHRTGFLVLLGDHFVGDEVEAVILRDGAEQTVTMRLQPLRPLVHRARYDHIPSYFVFAGMVFQPLSVNFLRTWTDWWDTAPKEFLHYYYMGEPTAERREVVALTQVLSDAVNVGYEDLYAETVKSVGGVVPRDLRHFAELVDACDDQLELRMNSGALVVFDAAEARRHQDAILARYRVPADRSASLDASSDG